MSIELPDGSADDADETVDAAAEPSPLIDAPPVLDVPVYQTRKTSRAPYVVVFFMAALLATLLVWWLLR